MTSWLGWGSSTEEDSSSGGELTAEEEESQKIHSTSELKEMCKNKCQIATDDEKNKIKEMRKQLKVILKNIQGMLMMNLCVEYLVIFVCYVGYVQEMVILMKHL